MLSKHLRLTFTLFLLCTAALLGTACDKTPDAAPEPAETAQPVKTAIADTPKPDDSKESTALTEPIRNESVQANAATLRDQFQKEANTSITIENAENILAELEAELNEEIAELERETPPKPSN